MARPYWSGQLKISLVSFGVKLFPATNPAGEIAFHQLDRESGERVHHLNIAGDQKPVDRSEIVKGYEYSKGKYLAIEPQEIARLRIKSRDTLEIAQFVDLAELPLALYEKPYFVVPQAETQPAAFAVIRRALEETGKAGLGEIAAAGREHLIAIAAPRGKRSLGLMAYTLRYGDELREAAGYFSAIKNVAIDKKQLGMATELIRQYSSPLNIAAFKDDYESALRELIEAKRKKKPLPLEEERPHRAKVISLTDALRRSVEQTKRETAGSRRRDRRPAANRTAPALVKSSKRRRKVA